MHGDNCIRRFCILPFKLATCANYSQLVSTTGNRSCTLVSRAAHRGATGAFFPGPSLKGAPGGPMKGPLNAYLKDRYTLIEQSDLNTLIEQSQYSSEEQCSKLIDKEIWLVMGSYCHCQQVVTFFFFFFFGLQLTAWVNGPTLTLCPGPLNFSGWPCLCHSLSRALRGQIMWGRLISKRRMVCSTIDYIYGL